MIEEDVKSLESGSLDDPGKKRLRDAFVSGWVSAALAVRCESVQGWVWAENPEHLATLQDPAFAKNYRKMTAWMRQLESGVEKEAPFEVSQWVVEKRSMHEDGSLPLEEHAILQSTAGWTWSGLLYKTQQDSAVEVLENLLTDAAFSEELSSVDRVGFEIVGRIFRAARVGFKRARLELHLEEFHRWTRTYPGYEVPPFATSRGVRLGSWVSKMRRQAHLGVLDPSTHAVLSGIPEWRWGLLGAEQR